MNLYDEIHKLPKFGEYEERIRARLSGQNIAIMEFSISAIHDSLSIESLLLHPDMPREAEALCYDKDIWRGILCVFFRSSEFPVWNEGEYPAKIALMWTRESSVEEKPHITGAIPWAEVVPYQERVAHRFLDLSVQLLTIKPETALIFLRGEGMSKLLKSDNFREWYKNDFRPGVEKKPYLLAISDMIPESVKIEQFSDEMLWALGLTRLPELPTLESLPKCLTSDCATHLTSGEDYCNECSEERGE